MKVELTDADRQYLRQLQKQRRDEEGHVKVTVILLLDEGWPASSIADDLGLDDATVYRYAHAWQQLGREKYLLHEARSYWELLCSAGLAALAGRWNRRSTPTCGPSGRDCGAIGAYATRCQA